jgi:hypothetical protein
MIVLGPGSFWALESTAQNQAMQAIFLWYERPTRAGRIFV